MKKLYILFIMFGLFFVPYVETQAALTPPASYDYSFAYNATDGEFQFSDGIDTYTPEFTRTANGVYWNYTWTGDADGLLPFEVTLTFNRSNTSWTLGSTGYIPTDTKIGSDSTVGTISKKYRVIINNITNNDYYFSLDLSSSSGDHFANLFYDTYLFRNASNRVYLEGSSNLNEFVLFSKYTFDVYITSTSANYYIDAMYFKDLGTSPAIQSTTAYDSGFTDGYNDGYLDGVSEDNAYSLGYALGLQEGQDMETGSSIIVLVLAIMAFALMLFGFTSKRRIFNLFASGLFIALGGILFEYPAFIIVTIGLVIVNVYYTFVSD